MVGTAHLDHKVSGAKGPVSDAIETRLMVGPVID